MTLQNLVGIALTPRQTNYAHPFFQIKNVLDSKKYQNRDRKTVLTFSKPKMTNCDITIDMTMLVC